MGLMVAERKNPKASHGSDNIHILLSTYYWAIGVKYISFFPPSYLASPG